jgi:hypothetical protein
MKSHHPFIRAFLLSLLVGMVMASATVAKAGGSFFRVTAASSVVEDDPATVACPGPDATNSNDQGTPDLTASDDQGESDDHCRSKDEGDNQETDSHQGPTPTSSDREAECRTAAGLTQPTSSSNAPAPQKTTGLDHAIEMVLANCIKNAQAPGLVNALRHLVANRDRHQAHEAEKAARKAAHPAAGGHGNGNGHGG